MLKKPNNFIVIQNIEYRCKSDRACYENVKSNFHSSLSIYKSNKVEISYFVDSDPSLLQHHMHLSYQIKIDLLIDFAISRLQIITLRCIKIRNIANQIYKSNLLSFPRV